MRLFCLIQLVLLMFLFSCKSDDEVEPSTGSVMVHHKLRPFYHYTPEANWMNDPNGMVWYDGEYHLFYQYFPNGLTWGPMHWGHAVSNDLFHWKDKGIALYPDEQGYIFSGSAVIDVNNTAGFKNGTESPMVAIYTNHGTSSGLQVQSLAYSNDKGESWTKYANNPILSNPGIADFRDPKVIWHEESQMWIMVLAVFDHIEIYSSPNLKDWTKESEFGKAVGYHGGVWECPDLFPLTDNQGIEKWVMIVSLGGNESSEPNGGSATQYFIGDFDGKSFSPESSDIKWVDYGIDNYAGVTWSNISENDGRRIFLGWMSNWIYADAVPESGWRSGMTVPREVKLERKEDKHVLYFTPVEELDNLLDNTNEISQNTISNGFSIDNHPVITGGSYLAEMEIDVTKIENLTISFGNEVEWMKVGYNKSDSQFFIDRSNSGYVDFNNYFRNIIKCNYSPSSTTLLLSILVDQNSIEVFINHGEKVMSALFFPKYDYKYFRVENSSQSEFLHSLNLKAIQKSVIR